ncbi:hypothetical protein H5410_035719 [Solanum commersonii]|uniref:Uncharacterized protein n=1 Tax=Solanum commersonii TaxID=4109 RepID=A0A9J5Y3N0_SOLCO|nr:hypothetical protein H5410_035719 [Solanum commersonii]
MVMNLPFDPMVSDRYEIVCIMKSDGDYNQYYVYSSETRGVYLNGCMHCVSEISSFLRFDLDSMCFRDMPSTLLRWSEIDYSKWFVKYSVDLSSLHEKTTRFLVSTPEVIIKYDYHRTTIKEIMKIEKGKIPVTWEQVSVFEWYDAHQYIEIMACV